MRSIAKKKCARCERRKPPFEFGQSRYGHPSSWCKQCHRDYDREYYRRDRSRYRRALKERRLERRLLIASMKHQRACADCGTAHPFWILEFDHVRGQKKFEFARAVRRALSVKTILDELAKCDVVCANCHRHRSFTRLAIRNGGFAEKRKTRLASLVIRALKRRSRCFDCGVRHAYFVLEFDHLAGKTLAISRLVNRGLSVDALRAELAKCEIVCVNCHRDRTFHRRFFAADPSLFEVLMGLEPPKVARVGSRRAVS